MYAVSVSVAGRLKNLSERAVRKVKTFVSRPIKESALQRFITKLEARKEAEESGRISVRLRILSLIRSEKKNDEYPFLFSGTDMYAVSVAGRLKNLSERAVRKVKTFVSRPIKESALQRFITKLEARKEAEESGRISGRELKQGDLPFPKPIQRTKSREFKEKSNERREPDTVDLKSVAQMPILCSGGDLPSGCKPVTGNKDNNGRLFIDDCQPFWTEQRKPTEADLADSDTEDVLQMNAEVALDVCDGNIKLVNMPTIP
ncbi:hypothetical protein OSTOST_04069 [Ostertagia ostertagi]